MNVFPFLVALLLLAPEGAPAAHAGLAAPVAPVPAPRPVSIADIPLPGGSNLEFYLDSLAPLGTGEGNAAAYFAETYRKGGFRMGEIWDADRGALDGKEGRVWPGDEPLLREAEPWTRLATLRFYPDFLRGPGRGYEAPDLLHLLRLGRSWRARGLETGGEAGREDMRRAIRLGRLLRQDDVTVAQDSVGLELVRIGLEGLYEIGRRDGDAATMVLAADAEAELAAERRAGQGVLDAGLRVVCSVTGKARPRLRGVSELDVETLTRAATDSSRARRIRLEALDYLWFLEVAGTPEQRRAAGEALRSVAAGDDPILWAGAAWLVGLKWDPDRLPVRCVRRIG